MINFIYNALPILPFFALMIAIILNILSTFFKEKYYFSYNITLFSLIFSIICFYFSFPVNFLFFSDFLEFDLFSKFSNIIILLTAIYSCVFNNKNFFLNNEFSIENLSILLLSVLGGICVSMSCNVISAVLGLELLFISSLGLLICNLPKNSIIKIFKYMLYSIFSSLLLFLGFGLIYIVVKNIDFFIFLNFFSFSNNYINLNIIVMILGMLLVFLSFFFKLSLFPFYFWGPEIYNDLSESILIYFSIIPKISIFTLFLHILSYIPYNNNTLILYFVLKCCAIFSIFFGNFMAIFQKNFKKMIGYMTISNMGVLLSIILFSCINQLDYKAFFIYFLSYSISLIGLFSVLTCFSYYISSQTEKKIKKSLYFNYFLNDHPIFKFFIFFFIFNFSGVPLTIGFWSKLYIIYLYFINDSWFFILLFFLNNLLGIYCYFSFFSKIYSLENFKNTKNKLRIIHFPFFLKFIIFLMILLSFVFSIFPHIFLKI